jgi:uncharacterized protein
MRSLLDVNVLIALLDRGHIHHRAAHAWLADNESFGWASCPITQLGCLRIMAQPAYQRPLPVAMVAEKLRLATAGSDHQFWPDTLEPIQRPKGKPITDVLGHRQLADRYLVMLAKHHQGRFISFDARIELTGEDRAHVFRIPAN